jgi:hypothetical protein
VLWSWKRCLYPAMFLLPLVLVVWAIIAVPGPWRTGLASFGVDPRYFTTQGMAISHPPVLGVLGGGRTPLGAQPLLLLGILLSPVLFGCLVAWLIHLPSCKSRSRYALTPVSSRHGHSHESPCGARWHRSVDAALLPPVVPDRCN